MRIGRRSLSSNHFSHDQQVADVIAWHLSTEQKVKLFEEFPEAQNIKFEGHVGSSAWDTEAMGVDVEYTSWLADWIEANTEVYWEDGEPWVGEDEDDDEP